MLSIPRSYLHDTVVILARVTWARKLREVHYLHCTCDTRVILGGYRCELVQVSWKLQTLFASGACPGRCREKKRNKMGTEGDREGTGGGPRGCGGREGTGMGR